MAREEQTIPKPILKWAGGKSQLLPEIKKRMPVSFNKYIEPFVGGGALFFNLCPKNAIISDSNPDLINLYNVIASNPEELVESLKQYRNEKDFFYKIRSLDSSKLSDVEKASRMIYLNRTCFNGLYRVNRMGQFNVPFGNYKNPKIVDEDLISVLSPILRDTKIILSDYTDILNQYAEEGDFVFLDPPYMPVGKYGDFKRYTKEQFYENDQRQLARVVRQLTDVGVKVILTNSNHPVILDLYKGYRIDIIPTKRNISSNGSTRKGEDIIVCNF